MLPFHKEKRSPLSPSKYEKEALKAKVQKSPKYLKQSITPNPKQSVINDNDEKLSNYWPTMTGDKFPLRMI